MAITCAAVAARERSALRDALVAAALPADDIDDGPARFYRFSREGRVCAYGGLEVHGRDVLLRSIVVLPDQRKRGLGRECVTRLEGIARENGLAAAYLATTSAHAFFARLDYAPVGRDAIPPAILATRQLAEICPANAVVMRKALGGS